MADPLNNIRAAYRVLDSRVNRALPCHVLTSVVTGALHNSVRSRVAHSEALRRNTTNESFTGRRAVQTDVTDDDVLFSLEGGLARGVDNETTSREAFPT